MPQAISNATIDHVRHRHHRREHAERLLQRAAFLSDDDRLLIEQVYDRGVSICDLARLTHTQPRRLRRRVVKLIQRLDSPLFLFVIRNDNDLPRDTRLVAKLAICNGYSMRRVAHLTGRSLHFVRQQLQCITTMARPPGTPGPSANNPKNTSDNTPENTPVSSDAPEKK